MNPLDNHSLDDMFTIPQSSLSRHQNHKNYDVYRCNWEGGYVRRRELRISWRVTKVHVSQTQQHQRYNTNVREDSTSITDNNRLDNKTIIDNVNHNTNKY